MSLPLGWWAGRDTYILSNGIVQTERVNRSVFSVAGVTIGYRSASEETECFVIMFLKNMFLINLIDFTGILKSLKKNSCHDVLKRGTML